MQIQLSDHFTYRRLLRFVFPSVMMMIFVSIAEIVDGSFVSNFAGKTPFAALNLIWPYFGIMGTVGFMFGTGGSALISKTLGEGDEERARRYFSLIIYTAIAVGVLPLLYFIRKKGSGRTASGRRRRQSGCRLYLTRTKFEPEILGRTCYNGLSELAANVSTSLVCMIYNAQLLKLAGENGVAAYGVIMYISMIFSAIFFGYSVGSAPIIGYHYGARNTSELHNMFQKSLKLVAVVGVCMAVFGIVCARPLALIFVSYDAELLELTVRAVRFYAISYLLCGFNIFASSFFPALSNGAVSATISVLRTLVFQVVSVLLLPVLFGLDGIWLALTAAEILALIVSIFFFAKMRGKYHY